MQKIKFKDIEISRLALGTMRFPMIDGEIDQNQVNEMVDYAINCGVNYFDTAIIYHGGNSEVALGIALEKHDRSKYYLADKMSFWAVKEESDLDKIFNEQLRKLKTDYIDFYLMHAMNPSNLSIAKKVDAFKWALNKKKEGKIKYLGFSIHASYELLLEVLEQADFEFVQIQYNYLDINDMPGELGYNELVKRNIPVMIMEPLKGGSLVNLTDNIIKSYTELGKTPVEMAFKWLYSKEGIYTILSGMSSMEQLTQNIDIFNNITELSKEEESAIEEVVSLIEKYQKVKCTGCNYCMPCPVGINIPRTFLGVNLASMSQGEHKPFIDYNILEKCVKCNKCVNKCPQSLNIPKIFNEIIESK